MELLNILYEKVYASSQGIFSWESMLVTGTASLISFCLFIFWLKRKALLNFQAWALLTGIINFVLTIHYSPINIFISRDLSTPVIRMLMLLQFLTTVVTIFRLWQISEKYIPRELLLREHERTNKKYINRSSFLAHGTALWHTLKNGGNDGKNLKKVKRNIEKLIKNKYA